MSSLLHRLAKLTALLSLAAAAPTPAQIATTARASSPVIVATQPQMQAASLTETQLDSPLSSFTEAGQRYWIATAWNRSGSGGLAHSLTEGGLDAPYQRVHWSKPTCNRNPSSNFCIAGANAMFTQFGHSDVLDLWFTSIHQPVPGGPELLAFVHEERVAGSGGVETNREGRTRIGLAWSSDFGSSWNYLGRIASAYGDPQPLNIQGVPYLVKDGYFYIYFVDSTDGSTSALGIATARAPVADVLAAARSGSLGSNLWKKHYNGAFAEPGLGGHTTPIAPWGITHTQAIHSSHTGKYYLALSFMSWTGIDSSVKLYESTDAVSWNLAQTVASEPAATLRPDSGYQYCSLIDRDGQPNAEAGQYFYLYCMKDPLLATPSRFAIYRWLVNVGNSVDTFRQSADFDSSQGPHWFYQRGTTSILDATWQGSYWQGADSWTRLYADALHPGNSEIPVLKWVAPRAGTVLIEGTVRDADLSCGDGVDVSVVHNGSLIFNTPLANGDAVGVSLRRTRQVAAGDGLFFMLAARGDNYCDMTRWDPSITYQ